MDDCLTKQILLVRWYDHSKLTESSLRNLREWQLLEDQKWCAKLYVSDSQLTRFLLHWYQSRSTHLHATLLLRGALYRLNLQCATPYLHRSILSTYLLLAVDICGNKNIWDWSNAIVRSYKGWLHWHDYDLGSSFCLTFSYNRLYPFSSEHLPYLQDSIRWRPWLHAIFNAKRICYDTSFGYRHLDPILKLYYTY